jgi:hypothetical protein
MVIPHAHLSASLIASSCFSSLIWRSYLNKHTCRRVVVRFTSAHTPQSIIDCMFHHCPGFDKPHQKSSLVHFIFLIGIILSILPFDQECGLI